MASGDIENQGDGTDKEVKITMGMLYQQLTQNSLVLQKLVHTVETHKAQVEGAMPLDAQGRADYGLHRQQHIKISADDAAMGEYKRAVTQRILTGAVGLFCTVLGYAFMPALAKFFGG